VIDPADPDQLFDLMRRHRITLKSRLGQNFMVDQSMRDAVADAAGIAPGDGVLEVGAGVGTLTVALAKLAARVTAVEFDRDLVPALRQVVADLPNV